MDYWIRLNKSIEAADDVFAKEGEAGGGSWS